MSTDSVQYGDGEKVKSHDQNDWIKIWCHHFLAIDEDHHPTFGGSYVKRHDYDDRQGDVPPGFGSGFDNRVWNVFGAYLPTGYHRSILRIVNNGGWAIAAPIYVALPSVEEFPELGKNSAGNPLPDHDIYNNLMNLAREDVDGVYEVVAKLNGNSLETCKMETPAPTDPNPVPFRVTGVPANNVIDASPGNVNLVQAGYWVFLKPLRLGDNLLELMGYSRNYAVQVRYTITVRERPDPTRF